MSSYGSNRDSGERAQMGNPRESVDASSNENSHAGFNLSGRADHEVLHDHTHLALISRDACSIIWNAVRRPSGFGKHFIDIPMAECTGGSAVVFPFFWPEAPPLGERRLSNHGRVRGHALAERTGSCAVLASEGAQLRAPPI